MIFRAGSFEVNVWEGGHPIWVRISYEGAELMKGIDARHLPDIAYAIERARIHAREMAPAAEKEKY